METNRNKVIEINLKDLFLIVLKKIWVMVLVGALLGCTLGISKFVQRVKTYDVLDISKKLNSEETDVEYQLRAENVDRARVITEMVSGLNNRVDSEKQYISDSILMKIDPNTEYKTLIQVVINVDSNKTGLEESIIKAYYNDIMNVKYLTEYAESIGTKPEYILELVSFDYDRVENSVISTDKNTLSVFSLYISIVGPSKDFCDDVSSIIKNELDRVNEELISVLAPHNFDLVENDQVIVDDSMRIRQLGHIETIQALQNQIATYYDLLKKVASDIGVSDIKVLIEYFDSHSTVDLEGIPVETSEKEESNFRMLKPAIKLALIGFCASFVCVALLYVLKYLLSRRILTQAQFFCCFRQISNIGVLKPTGKRSKFNRRIDILSEDDTSLSDEINRKLIVANYKNITSSYNKILITGTGDVNSMREAFNALALSGDFKPDIFSNPDVLASVCDYDAIVLLEQRKYSLFKNVDKEISLISNGSTPIVGAIII